jgi:osmotically-inducible protein OsmY
MLKNYTMKTDIQIQKDVMDQLRWDPFLNSSAIGVAVKNGIVTLSGRVDSYLKKVAVENAAKKIAGVKAIAEDIQIGISPENQRTDAEIAEAILNALKWHSAIQEEKIKIKVENGHVKLEGEVDWEFQRNNVKFSIEHLTGVRSITNLITVKPAITPTDIQKKINAAFHRNATIDAGNITAEVIGSRVILSGKVRSYVEKEDAANAAWSAPGIMSVDNNLQIEIPQYAFAE